MYFCVLKVTRYIINMFLLYIIFFKFEFEIIYCLNITEKSNNSLIYTMIISSTVKQLVTIKSENFIS